MAASTTSTPRAGDAAPAPRYLRVKDVAHRWSVSQGEVRRLVETGELHKVHIGASKRFFRITAASVEAYEDTLPAERP